MANDFDTSPGAVANAYPAVMGGDKFFPAYESAQRWNRAATGGPIGLLQALFGTVDPAREAAAYNQAVLGSAQGAEQGRLTTGYYDQANGQGQQAPPQPMPSAAPAPQGLIPALGGVPQAAMYPPSADGGLISAMGGGAPAVPGMGRPMPTAGGGWGPAQILGGLSTAARVPGLAKNMPAYIAALDTAIKEGKSIGPDGSIYNTPGALSAATLAAMAGKGLSTGGVDPTSQSSVNAATAGQAGATRSAEATAQNVSDLRYKPAIAAGEQEGRNRSDANWKPAIEGGIAASKVPAETMAALQKPQVDRTTGESFIPWDKPEVREQYWKSLATGGKGAPLPPVEEAAAAPSAPSAPVPYGTKKPIDEVPSVQLPSGLLPKSTGTIIQGRDPVAIKAGEEAVQQANEQYKGTADAAKAAQAIRAQIGTMRSQVQNGGVTPSATTPSRYLIAGYLNAIAGPEIAKQVTGLDPAAADVVNKEATRMGLTYARQTEGAREAVAGINIALKGNPQLGNTKEGFMKILDLIDAGAKRDEGAQQYANAMFQKNGHYVGAQEYFNQAHPAAEFTSKVIPYNAPRAADGSVDVSQLQPNVTYMGANGPGIWTGSGFKPVK